MATLNGVIAVMDLKTYLNGLPTQEREPFAEACETTVGHLRNVGYGLRPCAPDLAVLIEANTQGAVTRRDLRPEDWRRIWPELIGTQPAATQQEVGHG